MYPYTGITFIVCCVIAYKLLRRLYNWNDDRIKRRDAQRKVRELDEAIRLARLQPPPPPPATTDPTATWPTRNPITGTAGEWDHIPRIAFDLDTQLEFGGSRYHTVYVSPDDAAEFDNEIRPGLYITDKREGPELIGENRRKRTFIPHDQLIIR